jgi:hypothetical protein
MKIVMAMIVILALMLQPSHASANCISAYPGQGIICGDGIKWLGHAYIPSVIR